MSINPHIEFQEYYTGQPHQTHMDTTYEGYNLNLPGSGEIHIVEKYPN